VKLRFEVSRETPNTVVYDQVLEDGTRKRGILYVDKADVRKEFGASPEFLTVTVEEAEE
jgi:hypothetical protein